MNTFTRARTTELDRFPNEHGRELYRAARATLSGSLVICLPICYDWEFTARASSGIRDKRADLAFAARRQCPSSHSHTRRETPKLKFAEARLQMQCSGRRALSGSLPIQQQSCSARALVRDRRRQNLDASTSDLILQPPPCVEPILATHRTAVRMGLASTVVAALRLVQCLLSALVPKVTTPLWDR